jgi:hypothetical protein
MTRGSQFHTGERGRTWLRLIDKWETDKDLERHCRGERYRILLGALRALRAEAEVEPARLGEEEVMSMIARS